MKKNTSNRPGRPALAKKVMQKAKKSLTVNEIMRLAGADKNDQKYWSSTLIGLEKNGTALKEFKTAGKDDPREYAHYRLANASFKGQTSTRKTKKPGVKFAKVAQEIRELAKSLSDLSNRIGSAV